MPWAIIPVLVLITLSFDYSDATFQFVALYYPLCAWIGHQYKSAGVKAISVASVFTFFYYRNTFGDVSVSLGVGTQGVLFGLLLGWICANSEIMNKFDEILGKKHSYYSLMIILFIAVLPWMYSTPSFAGLRIQINGLLVILGLFFIVGITNQSTSKLISFILIITVIGAFYRYYQFNNSFLLPREFGKVSYSISRIQNIILMATFWYFGKRIFEEINYKNEELIYSKKSIWLLALMITFSLIGTTLKIQTEDNLRYLSSLTGSDYVLMIACILLGIRYGLNAIAPVVAMLTIVSIMFAFYTYGLSDSADFSNAFEIFNPLWIEFRPNNSRLFFYIPMLVIFIIIGKELKLTIRSKTNKPSTQLPKGALKSE